MVVVLIISILIAIAIPEFTGARQRAQDRAAQTDLRNGLTAEKIAYTATATPARRNSSNAAAVVTSKKVGGTWSVPACRSRVAASRTCAIAAASARRSIACPSTTNRSDKSTRCGDV